MYLHKLNKESPRSSLVAEHRAVSVGSLIPFVAMGALFLVVDLLALLLAVPFSDAGLYAFSDSENLLNIVYFLVMMLVATGVILALARFRRGKFVKWVLKIYNDWRKRITEYFNTSLTLKYAIGLRKELNILPIKYGSIIVVTAILSNLFFYVLFKNSMQKEIGLLGWIIRGILLFVGLAGLFCEVSLKNLKNSSLFLKWINPDKQSGWEKK